MPRISTLERSFGQMLNSSASFNTCRSCQSLVFNATRRHQFQTSTSSKAGFGLFGRKNSEEPKKEETPVRKASRGSGLPSRRTLREGWAETPQEDSNYIIATTGTDLEHVGSAKWIEQQFDAQGEYKGWSRLKKATGLPPHDAKTRVLEAAKEAGLDQAQIQEQGLAFAVSDMRTKFKIVKALRENTRIQIPDITMQRAETLRDFQKAILSKPKPKKLVMELLSNKELLKNGNLKIWPRRQTPIHKDKAVGRWKLIETELANRGLPITGHGIRANRGFDDQVHDTE